MIYSLKEAQKIYLGDKEISKLFLRNQQIYSSTPLDPYSNYVSLLLHFNDNFLDSSTNNFTVSAFGNPVIATTIPAPLDIFSPYVELNTNNVGDYLQIENNEAFGFGLGDFTIEMWIFTNELIFGDYNPIIDLRTNAGGNGVIITLNGNKNIEVINPGGSPSSFTSLNSLTNGRWQHLAVQRKDSVWQIYIDGILDPSTTVNANFLELSRPCFIGSFVNTSGPTSRFLHAFLDEIRITKGIARYDGNFTPPTSQFPDPIKNYNQFKNNLLAYWSFDDSSEQPSIGNYTAVVDGGSWTVGSGVYNLGASLGSGQRIRVSQNLWNVRTNPLSYSVSFWVKPNQLANTGQETVLLGSCFGDMGFFFNLGNIAPQNFSDVFNQHVNFWLATGGSFTYKNVLVPYTTNVGTWYHITGTYDLPNETAKLYINGTLVGTTTGVLNNNCTNVGWTGFAMNGSPVGTTSSEYGKAYTFDMVGFWTRTLTDIEVQSLYSDYAPINDFIVS